MVYLTFFEVQEFLFLIQSFYFFFFLSSVISESRKRN